MNRLKEFKVGVQVEEDVKLIEDGREFRVFAYCLQFKRIGKEVFQGEQKKRFENKCG